MRILVLYHCLFHDGSKILSPAVNIVAEQMAYLKGSGLLDACDQMIVGINGESESEQLAKVLLPTKAHVIFHGLQCKNELRTLRILEEWLPGHEDWCVLYFHSKGATRPSHDLRSKNWRECMMRQCVGKWKRCVSDLKVGFEAVGCHWFTPPKTPPGQYIFAGNFFFAKASFLRTLPSLMLRDRIKTSGIDSVESRYEAEIILGNGPRPPIVHDYHPNWKVDARTHP